MNISRYSCCHTYKPQLVEHERETYYGPHSVMLGGVPNTNIVRNVPRLPNSSTNSRGGQSSGPIRTSHNSHTHTGNTRQSKPQLKRCHSEPQLKNVTCLTLSWAITHGIHSEPQLKEHSSKLIIKVSLKSCRPRISKATKYIVPTLSPSAGLESLGDLSFQAA